MRFNTQNPRSAVVLVILVALVASVLFGQIVAGSSYKYALAVVLAVIVFLVTLVNTDAGLAILIFSMLLSPEIMLAQVPGRDVVIRADDILLAVITFSWLAKMAINKGLAIFVKTPLNKIIGLYLFLCYVSTVRGMALGYLGLEKGFFYLLRYTEYFLLFILVANHVHSRKQIKFFLKTFFIVCAIVSVIGILQIPSGERVSAPFE